MIAASAEPLRAELRFRERYENAVWDIQEELVSRLQTLEANDTLQEITLECWGRWVRDPASCETGTPEDMASPAWEKYTELEDWAGEQGYDLSPAFKRNRQVAPRGNDHIEVVVFPIVCLVVYKGEDIEAVAPCQTNEGTLTVEECLSHIEQTRSDPASELRPEEQIGRSRGEKP